MDKDIYLKVTFIAHEFQVLRHGNDSDDILNYAKYIKL
jgi:hypothetical protein